MADDLTAFWRDMYPKVKAELSQRYPRQEWRWEIRKRRHGPFSAPPRESFFA